MVVETDSMRLDMLRDFGSSSATFSDTSAGTTSTIYALLRDEYLRDDVGGEVPVESKAPYAMVRSSDVPSVAQGDTLAISGTTYTVVEVEPREGMTDLRLRE